MSDRPPLAACLLAGGSSRRMGRTKAAIEVGGRRMIDRVIDAVRDAGCDPILVVGGAPAELAPLDVPIVPDRRPGEGPLGGVGTALAAVGPSPSGVLVVPCDLPMLTGAALRPLIDHWHARSSAGGGRAVDVVVARTDRLEPMCAVWSVEVGAEVDRAVDEGTRAVHEFLARVRVVEVDVDPGALRNVNTETDLADLGELGSAP